MSVPRRTHIGTKDDFRVPGGLHNVIRGLSAGQASIGLKVDILHKITGPDEFETLDLLAGQSGLQSNTDVVYEYHFAQTAATMLGSDRLRQGRSIFHFHGPWSGESRAHGQSLLRSAAKFMVEWGTYRRFDAFTVHSKAFRKILVSRFRVPEDRVHLVYPGVDSRFYTPGNQREARETLGLPQDRVILGSIRRLVPRMGLDLLLRAAANHPELLVALAGEGPQRSALESLAGELGIANRVVFLGRLPDREVPTFYRSLSCSVIPSRALEGFGLVVLEAMSCGIPVIAADVGGLPEAMGPFAAEWTFPANDLHALTVAIDRMVVDPPETQDLLRYARSRSWKRCAIEVEGVLAKVAG